MKAILILHLFLFNEGTGDVTVSKQAIALRDIDLCNRVAELVHAELKVSEVDHKIRCEDLK